MTQYRTAAKVDAAQEPVVKALRQAGIQVWSIRQPCDLLLRFWCNRHRDFCWQTLEVKTAYGKKSPKPRLDTRQKDQKAFLEGTDTPVAMDFNSAWCELNKRHALGRVEVSYPLKPLEVRV